MVSVDEVSDNLARSLGRPSDAALGPKRAEHGAAIAARKGRTERRAELLPAPALGHPELMLHFEQLRWAERRRWLRLVWHRLTPVAALASVLLPMRGAW